MILLHFGQGLLRCVAGASPGVIMKKFFISVFFLVLAGCHCPVEIRGNSVRLKAGDCVIVPKDGYYFSKDYLDTIRNMAVWTYKEPES